MAGDKRWKPRPTVAIFLLQTLFIAALIGLTAPAVRNRLHAPPLALALITAISLIIHIASYYTSNFHTLVVLTLALEFTALWLALSIYLLVLYPSSLEVNCQGFRRPQGAVVFGSDGGNCRISTAVLAFTILTMLSFFALVIHSLLTHRRLRNPQPPIHIAPGTPPQLPPIQPSTPLPQVQMLPQHISHPNHSAYETSQLLYSQRQQQRTFSRSQLNTTSSRSSTGSGSLHDPESGNLEGMERTRGQGRGCSGPPRSPPLVYAGTLIQVPERRPLLVENNGHAEALERRVTFSDARLSR